MNVAAFSVRPDERTIFEQYAHQFSINLTMIQAPLRDDNLSLCAGNPWIVVMEERLDAGLLARLHQQGVRGIATRSASYDQINLEALQEFGMQLSAAPYSPHSVADFTMMLILMVLRKANRILSRFAVNDFSLGNIQGRELHNLTAGIIGTGRIGSLTAKRLHAFGTNVLACDPRENHLLERIVRYTDLDDLLAQSDLIILHAPLNNRTWHMINKETLNKCKSGAWLINTARGALVDSEALIEALRNNQLGGAALDVLEDETGYHEDCDGRFVSSVPRAILRANDRVILTPHCAFFTDQAVHDMVEIALRSLLDFEKTGQSAWEVRP